MESSYTKARPAATDPLADAFNRGLAYTFEFGLLE